MLHPRGRHQEIKLALLMRGRTPAVTQRVTLRSSHVCSVRGRGSTSIWMTTPPPLSRRPAWAARLISPDHGRPLVTSPGPFLPRARQLGGRHSVGADLLLPRRRPAVAEKDAEIAPTSATLARTRSRLSSYRRARPTKSPSLWLRDAQNCRRVTGRGCDCGPQDGA